MDEISHELRESVDLTGVYRIYLFDHRPTTHPSFGNTTAAYLVYKPWYLYRDHACAAKDTKHAQGSHLEALDRMAQTGHFAGCSQLVRTHKNQRLRTLASLARESQD